MKFRISDVAMLQYLKRELEHKNYTQAMIFNSAKINLSSETFKNNKMRIFN